MSLSTTRYRLVIERGRKAYWTNDGYFWDWSIQTQYPTSPGYWGSAQRGEARSRKGARRKALRAALYQVHTYSTHDVVREEQLIAVGEPFAESEREPRVEPLPSKLLSREEAA